MFKVPLRCAACCSIVFMTGCIGGPGGPGYMSQPYPYQQPMYAPPTGINPPGTFVVPPSNAPAQIPSSGSSGSQSYEPESTFGNGDSNRPNTPFYSDDKAEEGVPKPIDAGGDSGGVFQNDLGTPEDR